MILCDFNMVSIMTVVSHANYTKEPLDEATIRQVVLNAMRQFNKQFRQKYGQLILCCDSRSLYWRKKAFPFYKYNRKKARAASSIDYKLIFDTLDKLRAEITDSLPYRLIEVDEAEADDIIAVLTKEFHKQEDILILSSDKDFVQLQKYPNVKQWNPMFKRFVSVADPLGFTKEHIIRGDYGDGIPNIRSTDNCIAVGERQKSINSKNLAEWMTLDIEALPEDLQPGYLRNQALIDFDFIPTSLAHDIMRVYTKTKPASKMKTVKYFMEKDLSGLMEVIDEF